ncbi:hypothetical protein LIER_36974 [Lithospermum erythrorhizon]|uniref:Reverse transcriptase zinc-binding domain-containing protein n=1 Tax=Lithospermum erythrorhizon TaxID=34254 RepID=A0AAV3PDI3_LITER
MFMLDFEPLGGSGLLCNGRFNNFLLMEAFITSTCNVVNELTWSLCTLRDTLVAAYGSRVEAIEGLEGCCVGDKLVSKLIYEKLCTYRVKRPWMSAIWKGFITPKYSFVVWLTCRTVWKGIRDWLGIRRDMSTIDSSIKWILKEHIGGRLVSRTIRLAFCCAVYIIWLARNV